MTPNPNPSPELKPCPNPWCHSHERDFPLHRLGIIEWPIVHGRIGFRVRCSDCGICGPIVETKVAVYAAWNTRVLSPQTLPAPGEVETGTGWVAWNPDSGEEYTPDHPVESGECVEAERIRRSTPQEDTLWTAFQEQFMRAEALSAASLATVAAANDEGVARIRSAIWGYVNAQPEDAATLPVVQFLANRDVFLAEAIALATSRSRHEGAGR